MKSFCHLISTAFALTAVLCSCERKATVSTSASESATLATHEDPVLMDLKRLAVAGEARAQYELAKKYDAGEGVVKDQGKAFEWHSKAAEQGHAGAQNSVGKSYELGKGVPKDESKAVVWYRKAAEQGDSNGQYNLGRSYAGGVGVSTNDAIAVEWFSKAADQGHADAQNSLGHSLRLGKGIQKDAMKAVEWIKNAANQGNAAAQTHLGDIYAVGLGLPIDLKIAVEWYRKAAEQGDAVAQKKLSASYANGQGVPKDTSKAVEWLSKAAEQGDADAQTDLGFNYWNGQGLPKDASRAVEWFRRAAEQGHPYAQNNLGVSYSTRQGSGTTQDSVLAYAWLNLASVEISSAVGRREELAKRMSAAELTEAQQLATNWKTGQAIVRLTGKTGEAQGEKSTTASKSGTGTGFFVDTAGHVITNHHVTEKCKNIRAEGQDGDGKVIATDMTNDLALLQVPGSKIGSAMMSGDPDRLRQGDAVVVFGFPLNSLLSSGGNLTPGVVSALTGLNNNTNQIQVTAAVQPGSSGSPVLNAKAEVVAMVSSKLSDAELAKATGQIGQSINFAIGGRTLNAFLKANNIDFKTGGFLSFTKSMPDLADEARKWTIVVECWK